MTFEPTQPIGPNDGAKLRDYKIVCAKLGLVMCAYFLCRMIGGLISGLVLRVGGAGNAAPAISMAITVIMVYVVPMLLTAAVFKSFSYYNAKSENFRRLYKKPVRLAQAIGTFPAMYGLGYGIAVLTFLASFLITRATGGHTVIEDILRPTTLEPSANVVSALLMVFVLVVIAPVFEEVWVRGIMYDALKPYGDGIAIIISSVLFGLMHGSIHMLFYTTALGFALGYVRYATNSLLVVTILHAVINAIAAGMLLIMSMADITLGASRLVNTIQNIYMLAVLVLIVIGVVAFVRKIPTIRKYRIENAWVEIPPRRKIALFFISLPVIIMLVLAFNELTNFWVLTLFIV